MPCLRLVELLVHQHDSDFYRAVLGGRPEFFEPQEAQRHGASNFVTPASRRNKQVMGSYREGQP
jgi:hypothetical protein